MYAKTRDLGQIFLNGKEKIFVVQGDGVHTYSWSPKKITVRRAKPEKKVGQMTGNRSPHHCEIIPFKKVYVLKLWALLKKYVLFDEKSTF